MIVSGFDNVNVTLQCSLPELKVIYHSLEHIDVLGQRVVSEEMQRKNFKEYGTKEVFAVLKQFQLVIGSLAGSLERVKTEDADMGPPVNTLVQ